MTEKLSKTFLKRLSEVKGKRSRIVVDHILKHGQITTEDLKETYGYNHPPRAVRDVREQGIPIETFKTVGKHGRKIAGYRFGDPKKARGGRHAGRSAFSKKFKSELIQRYGERCAICSHEFEERYLQIDHRVPYEVAGDKQGNKDQAEFMLICGSCNRAKSWSCEHCQNWLEYHDAKKCKMCYWGSPEKYNHIALCAIRRLDLVWGKEEIPDHDRLNELSKNAQQKFPDFVKEVLRKHIDR